MHSPWRAISTFNAHQHPALPLFHYSLACNHCTDAPCMSSCPALAFTKDAGMNTIVHHADRCIGCKYCTWACPYDAPKYAQETGTVEKCTLCRHRLEQGKKPACANLCPTGALDYGEFERVAQHRVPGFTEKGIGPGVRIVRLRSVKPPRTVMKLDAMEQRLFQEMEGTLPSKVSLKNEWVLVLFTLLVPALTALVASASLGWMVLDPFLFMAAGIAGLVLSSIHLGKKLRAWRSLLNVRNSWLSREILGYGLFLLTSFAYLLYPGLPALGLSAAVFGMATAWCIDKVYLHFEKDTRLDIRSNSVFLTALLLTSMAVYNERFAVLILCLKGLLYIYRKLYYITHGKRVNYLVSMLRLFLGLAVPAWVWYSYPADPLWIVLPVLAGELIDRAEFYAGAEVISPKRQIAADLARMTA